jgi:hypothetical protein
VVHPQRGVVGAHSAGTIGVGVVRLGFGLNGEGHTRSDPDDSHTEHRESGDALSAEGRPFRA